MNCGDIEENPGLLETRLREFNRIAVDVGGGGDCFFRAVSHQLYGNPNNYYLVRSLGIQYLMHNPEQFIQSNTDYSWQRYLNNMSCQRTWADAIIIQAVANCLNLSIHLSIHPLSKLSYLSALD